MTQTDTGKPAAVHTEIVRYRAGVVVDTKEDKVAVEEPLEIRVHGRSLAVTMRTPGDDGELAAGFLLSEGLIAQRGDIVEIGPCLQSNAPENTLNVFLAPSVAVNFERLTRHVFASSSCGLCGKATIDAIRQTFPAVSSKMSMTASLISQLPERLRRQQRTFELTGGLHAAAIFDSNGELVVLREDVGRHNAVDKALGCCLLNGKLPLSAHVLLVSGRASFEIVQKALAAQVPMICAVSAPSNLAVEFARENDQALIGFLRGDTMNVYAGGERVSGRPT